MALRKEPQLLEKLGVKVRVGKTAAQRGASTKAAAARAAKKEESEEPVADGALS